MLFSFDVTATTEIYTLSLHDALPIWLHALDITTGLDRLVPMVISGSSGGVSFDPQRNNQRAALTLANGNVYRSEEHTSELQSRRDLVCRLLLEKKKIVTYGHHQPLST